MGSEMCIRDRCNGAAAQVIAVTETAGKDNGFNALQVSVFVPELHHVEAEVVAQRMDHVHVAIRAGEGDYTNLHGTKFGILSFI